MDLSTSYLGMNLRTPLVPSASPLTRNIDDVKRLEDAGAAAVVFHSVFEEQLRTSPKAETSEWGPSFISIISPRQRSNVRIPIIASLNAATPGGWVHYARQIEQAGATRWNSIFTIFPRTWIAAEARSSKSTSKSLKR